jgi:hypothetical protein
MSAAKAGVPGYENESKQRCQFAAEPAAARVEARRKVAERGPEALGAEEPQGGLKAGHRSTAGSVSLCGSGIECRPSPLQYSCIDVRTPSILVFAAVFVACAWFHQGGGWNQNARFAEVRAIVEQGRFAIDDFLVYRPAGDRFTRVPIENGEVELNGMRLRLAWVDDDWRMAPINGPGVGGVSAPLAILEEVAASGDVSFAAGHFHPNKPPGCTLAAVPAYWLIFQIERALGISPDSVKALTLNAWLAGMLSVGLASAFGALVFLRFARRLSGENETVALLATFGCWFGTFCLPYGTMLYDHNLTAVALLAAAERLSRPSAEWRAHDAAIAGAFAGAAVLTNYVAVVSLPILAGYLLWKGRGLRGFALFLVGGVPLLILHCAYHWTCYGSAFALSNQFQNPLFSVAPGHPAVMFRLPDPLAALALLISPFRGLFVLSPVVILSLAGWWTLRKKHPQEASLAAAMCGLFFLVNITFSGWHAGFACGPRYLIPAMPFALLAAIPVMIRFPRAAAALTALSVAIQVLLTSVDAHSPLGIGGLARIGNRPQWFYNQLTEYAGPLFFTGRAWPILSALREQHLEFEAGKLAQRGFQPKKIEERLAALRGDLDQAIRDGTASPFLLAAFHGPVSANPVGMYEGEFLRAFGPHDPQTAWNSFNVGEFFWPESRWSLVPFLVICGGLAAAAFRCTIRRAPPLDPVHPGS